jgi:amino acid adenylation domain-containing protein
VRALGRVFAESAERHPNRPALVVDGSTYTYAELLEHASRIADAIRRVDPDGTPLCAVLAERSLWAYSGILAALLSGRAYVPLSPSFPADRTATMLERSTATALVVDPLHVDALESVLGGVSGEVAVLCPGSESLPPWASSSPHRLFGADELAASGEAAETAAGESGDDGIAYLLFTSGTTGVPKGIGIRDANVMAYLESAAERFDVGPEDRCSQAFALTFDLSVHDMFVCWAAGACLCVPPARMAMAPGPFIRDQAITCWFSTPSTAVIMERLRMLTPGAFPTLRWSLFCGEALTADTAAAWHRAAPSSVIDNLYGPTEATIACTAYRYAPDDPPERYVNGVVPIGHPFGRTSVAVVDGDLRPVPAGTPGELLLSGDQLAPGYWHDPERTAAAFVEAPALAGGPWYRTGDLASIDEVVGLVYRGRIDDQIKIRGHRVELQEIEAAARAASGAAAAVALGWPVTAAGADGVILYLVGASTDDASVISELQQTLPAYMIPAEINHVDSLPLNPSGKVDRRRLLAERDAMPPVRTTPTTGPKEAA